MATLQFRQGSVLGMVFARGKAKGKPRRSGVLSAWRRFLLTVAVALRALVVPACALGFVTVGAWQWAEPAGWIMLGVSLLILDASAGTGGPKP